MIKSQNTTSMGSLEHKRLIVSAPLEKTCTRCSRRACRIERPTSDSSSTTTTRARALLVTVGGARTRAVAETGCLTEVKPGGCEPQMNRYTKISPAGKLVSF